MSKKDSRQQGARIAGGRDRPARPMAWTPVKFQCGHYLAMGEQAKPGDVDGTPGSVMHDFLGVASWTDCPMCGSGTGQPSPPLKPGERRYLVHNDLYYREMPPEWIAMADQNFTMARLRHPIPGEQLWHSCPDCGISH